MSEHVAGGHDKHDGDGEDGPGPATAEDGAKESNAKGEGEHGEGEGDPGAPVERGTVWNGYRCVRRELVGELGGTETTVIQDSESNVYERTVPIAYLEKSYEVGVVLPFLGLRGPSVAG